MELEKNKNEVLVADVSGSWLSRLELLLPLLILGVTAVSVTMLEVPSGQALSDQMAVEIDEMTGRSVGQLSDGELARVYLESSVQKNNSEYEMLWATSCSSAAIRVAGVDAAQMEKISPKVEALEGRHGKADYISVDRILGQNAYLVCTLYDVNLSPTQQQALKQLRSNNGDFSCLTPYKRACAVAPL